MLFRFFREWVRQLVLSSPYVKEAERIVKLLLSLIALLFSVGVIGVLKTAEIPIPWWGYLPVLALVWWLSLTAGIAVATSRVPWMKVENDLWLDDIAFPTRSGTQGRGVFAIMIRNGDVPAVPRVQIDLSDIEGKLPEHSYDAHWRGKSKRVLNIDEPQQFGLFGVDHLPSSNPRLFLWEPDDAGHPMTRDVPLREQKAVTFRVIITCESESTEKDRKERGQKLELIHSIAPDLRPGQPIPYRIVSVTRKATKRRNHFCYLLRALRSLRLEARKKKIKPPRTSKPAEQPGS